MCAAKRGDKDKSGANSHENILQANDECKCISARKSSLYAHGALFLLNFFHTFTIHFCGVATYDLQFQAYPHDPNQTLQTFFVVADQATSDKTNVVSCDVA